MLKLADCTVDLDTRTVTRDDKQLRLTGTEVRLLKYLTARPHEVISREELYREVWEHQADLLTRTLDLAIFRLRKKIEQDPRNPSHVMTVYGRGYSFVPIGEEVALPPATKPERTTNLGRGENHFFGREAEQQTLTDLMKTRSGFITVIGPPGTGKTRLTKHWAASHLASGSIDSAWFCDLTEARTEEGCIQAIAVGLGVSLTTTHDSTDKLTELISRSLTAMGSTIVVIDNTEQVVEWIGPLVAHWWEHSPRATFVLTSQVPTGVGMEQRMPLLPLPMPSSDNAMEACPATQLFVDRAKSVHPNFELTEQNRDDIAAIVRSLDGLPLAIELAAARMHLMNPATLYSRLSDRFRVLKRPKNAGHARHHTLHAALDWSWDLLEPYEQSALAQCSVFHGGFDWAAVEAVIDLSDWPDAPWTIDVVAELIERSLVMVNEDEGGIGRLMLLACVDEYAHTRLQAMPSSPHTDAALRHARHYALLANVSDRHDKSGAHRQAILNKELENLLAGIPSALNADDAETAGLCTLAAAQIFQSNGPFSDAISLLEDALVWDTSPNTHARLLSRAVWMLHRSGRANQALAVNTRALDFARSVGDRHHEGKATELLGHIYQAQGKLHDALHQYKEAGQVAREIGNRHSESTALSNIAEVYREMGDLKEAMDFYRQALVIHRERSNRRSEGIVLGNLAILHRRRGENARARDHYTMAISIHREVGNLPFVGLALGNLALLEFTEGNVDQAEDLFTQALDIHRSVGDRRSEGNTLGNLAHLHHTKADQATARQIYEEAIAICDETAPVPSGLFRSGLALVCAEQGDIALAYEHLAEGEQRVPATYQVQHGSMQCQRARVAALAGDTEAAQAAMSRAQAIASELQSGTNSDLAQEIDRAKEYIKKYI